MSVLNEYILLNIDSGAIYKGVPTLQFPRLKVETFLDTENPKSANLGIPLNNNILAGFISRWIISRIFFEVYIFTAFQINQEEGVS